MSKMMNDQSTNYQLRVECHHKPEVLERVLRVVRHRGFALETLSMDLSTCGSRVMADMVVSSSRSLTLLTSQIEKLYDVVQVDIQQESACPLSQAVGLA